MHRLAIPFLLFLSALTSRAEESLAGRWEGSASIPEHELKLVVDLARDDAGHWIGSIIIPGLGVKGTALSDIVVNGGEVSFALKSESGRSLESTFKAKAGDNKTLTGTFTEAGNTAPLALTKVGAPQVEAPTHSTAITKELEGEWKGSYELLGYSRQVSLKLKNDDKKGAGAELVIVGKKVNNLPVNLIEQEGTRISVDSSQTGIWYEARFDDKTGELKGTLWQGSLDAPLILRKAK